MERKSVECPLGSSCNAGGRHFPDSALYKNHAKRASGSESRYDFAQFETAMNRISGTASAKQPSATGIDLSTESAFVTGLGDSVTGWAANDAGDIYEHVTASSDPREAAREALDDEIAIDWAHDSIYGSDSAEHAIARARNYLAQRPDASIYEGLDADEAVDEAQLRLADEYDVMFKKVAEG